MESKMMFGVLGKRLVVIFSVLLCAALAAESRAQEQALPPQPEEAAQLKLRKTVQTREFEGRAVEGEEKVIQPGDSLWRILIQEKGLPEKQFGRYLVIVRTLNPHIKKLDLLEVGDTLFIPIRPDEFLGIKVSSDTGEARIYKVQRGDHLYKILREQYNLRDLNKIRKTFETVKDLNPRKNNWDLLFVGEKILIPGTADAPAVVAAKQEQEVAPKPSVKPAQPVKVAKEEPPPVVQVPQEIIGLDYGRKVPAEGNLDLLEQVMGALGNETRRGGEEVLALRDGTVRIDLNAYPIIQNPKRLQRVILDLGGKIPSSLGAQLKEERSAAPVVSVKKGASLHDAVATLISHLGFEPLPSNRPVVIQDQGIGVHVMGEWMATAPDAKGEGVEIFVVSLTDFPGRTPGYLRDYLSVKGMNLKEILVPPAPLSSPPVIGETKTADGTSPIENWPEGKSALVDAFLKSYQISPAVDEIISVELGEGIRLDTKMDRLFEFGGAKVGISFNPLGAEVKRALQAKSGVRTIEIDFAALSSRDIIARLLAALEAPVVYREHRFPALDGKVKDKLVLSVAGFFLPNRSVLLTDHEVPKGLQRFFAEKNIRVVQFK